MMKTETDAAENTSSIFPIDVPIREIQSINYLFDPETVKLWSSEVVTYGEIKRNIKFEKYPFEYLDDYINDVPDVQLLISIIKLQRQLIEDFYVSKKRLKGFDKPIDVQLQLCALMIYSAKCWEDLAFNTHSMFSNINRDASEKHLKYIYIQYIIPCYEEASGSLNFIGRSLPPAITDEQKKLWATMMLYARGKYLTTLGLYGTKYAIEMNERHYHNKIEKLLYNNGLGYLVPDYKPEISDDRGFLETTQSLLWSGWQKMYNAVCGVERLRYEQLPTQQQENETIQAPESRGMTRDEVVPDADDATGLRKRHLKSNKLS